jgi:tetratricopeptide (TPR) repeat protein
VSVFGRAWNWVLSRFFRRLGDAQRHFGNLHGSKEEHWAAIGNYTRAAVLDPTYAEVYYSRGVLYWREIGNYTRAIQDLTQTLELEPARTRAYFDRGLAYKLHNESARAIADFERYLAEGHEDFWLEAARRQLAELRGEPELLHQEERPETVSQ